MTLGFRRLEMRDSFLFAHRAKLLRIGVGAPLAAGGGNDVDEATVVLDPALGTARLLLFLLLSLNFGGLASDLQGVKSY